MKSTVQFKSQLKRGRVIFVYSYNSCQCMRAHTNIDKERVALVNFHGFSTVKIHLYVLE